MIPRIHSTIVGALASLVLSILPASAEEGFVPMFNGRDLSGWINVNCAPETWAMKDGIITCTGVPTGALRTEKQYENFIMEVEWRHMKSGGNAGIFIWSSPIAAPGVPFLRAIEVQVLDHGYGNTKNYTTHGDVFPIHGATMKPFGEHSGMRSFPSERRSKPSPEWNHYRIECKEGVLRLSVNGKEVSGGEECNWRKGYIGLESEGAPTEWRNIRIKELPASGAKPEQSAPEAQGHRSLYTGLDTRGWKTGTPERWKPSDWRLTLASGKAGEPLWTELGTENAEIILDSKRAGGVPINVLVRRGSGEPVKLKIPGSGQWTRTIISMRGGTVTAKTGDAEKTASFSAGATGPVSFGLHDDGEAAEFANLYVRELKD
jgi:hypothetical protein